MVVSILYPSSIIEQKVARCIPRNTEYERVSARDQRLDKRQATRKTNADHRLIIELYLGPPL